MILNVNPSVIPEFQTLTAAFLSLVDSALQLVAVHVSPSALLLLGAQRPEETTGRHLRRRRHGLQRRWHAR